MPREVTEQGEHERERIVHEIQTLNGSMEEAVLTALLQNLLSMDLTIQQLKVLMILVTTEEGATGRSLSASFGVSMASMSGLLDRLVGQGVATRSTDPHDHRVRRVHATPLGTSVVRRLAVARPFRRDILMGLRMEDLRALEQGFRAVSEQISLMGERD
ncbi:MarR family winged helix-turn-helix transcriptional regulator [Nocardiopsis sp. NPDC101807]|uniref:MarR family transcriptional regulator n=1 Tax=Streptomonospora nanhaiensis TaxID=1323731 RepID=A0ABY6YUE8_9ACTN|nr:MarR family transcriptional regulator [Streptomonospora nanhaiensis]WAE75719.1 MarR family transcriptional regulator [Streptomonospora nanhaiensis]